MKLIAATIFLLACASPALAAQYTYICKAEDGRKIVKIDDVKNTLIYRGETYTIKEQPDCAKFGWHATSAKVGEFDFCTATQGYADFVEDGNTIPCDQRR